MVVDGRTTYRYVAGTGGSPHLLTFPLYVGTTLAVPAVTSLRFVSNDSWASATAVTVRVSTLSVG